jgi:hypothetical protein
MRSWASAEHRANFDDRLLRQLIDRQQSDDGPKRPRYHAIITGTSSAGAVARTTLAGHWLVLWNLSRRTLDLFGYADDLPLSGWYQRQTDFRPDLATANQRDEVVAWIIAEAQEGT